MTTSSITRRRLAVLALFGAGTFWGVSFLVGKLAFREVEVLHAVLARLLLGGLVLLPTLRGSVNRLRWSDAPLILLVGLLMGPGTLMLQFLGLARTTASSAALLIGGIPPMLALATAVLFRDRLPWYGWFSVGMSTAGVALVVGLPGPGHDLLGDLLVFLSLFAVIAWILLMRRLVDRLGPLPTTALVLLAGALWTAPVAFSVAGPFPLDLSAGAWASLAVLGFVCTGLTYALWNWGVQYAPVAYAGVFTNLEPLVGALLGVFALGETPGPGLVLGGSLILVATFIVSLDRETPVV